MNERRTLSPPLRFGKIKFLLDLIFRIATLCVRHYPFSQGLVSNAIDYQSPHNALPFQALGQSIQSCHLYLCSTPLTAIYSSHVGGQFPSPLGLHHWFITLEELKMSTSHLLKVAYLLLFLFAWPNRQPILVMLFTV